jgi:hypothetical protein
MQGHQLVTHLQWGNVLKCTARSMFTSYVTDRQRPARFGECINAPLPVSRRPSCTYGRICLIAVVRCVSIFEQTVGPLMVRCRVVSLRTEGMELYSWDRPSRSNHTQIVKVVEKLATGLKPVRLGEHSHILSHPLQRLAKTWTSCCSLWNNLKFDFLTASFELGTVLFAGNMSYYSIVRAYQPQ